MFDNQNLKNLRSLFNAEGFDIRYVGGCVRDYLSHIEPKDYDLCTDANPDQQIAIYEANNLRYIPTGLQHGTVSVVLDEEVYEITSLRIDTEHDGRHAKVVYTNDWEADLGRRDLTINAMSMTLDGELFDPFGGEADLNNKVVRFVGNPIDRITEDYLRILRWYRFYGRFGGYTDFDPSTVTAVSFLAHGLGQISRERVWSEMSKILSGTFSTVVIHGMINHGVFDALDIPKETIDFDFFEEVSYVNKNPVALFTALIGDHVLKLDWKWSTEEKVLAKEIIDNKFRPFVTINDMERYYVINKNAENTVIVANISLTSNVIIGQFKRTARPVFPITGKMLIQKGVKPGKEMGDILARMKQAWMDSDFTKTVDELYEVGL